MLNELTDAQLTELANRAAESAADCFGRDAELELPSIPMVWSFLIDVEGECGRVLPPALIGAAADRFAAEYEKALAIALADSRFARAIEDSFGHDGSRAEKRPLYRTDL